MSDTDDVISAKAEPTGNSAPAGEHAYRDMAVYGLLRLLLFIGLTIFIMGVAYLIGLPVPLLVAAMLALFVAFPLSMFLWSDLRLRVNTGIAARSAERKKHKESIRQQLADRETN